MALTESQSAALKAAILADQNLSTWVQERRDDLIAAYYNEPASPAFIVWKTFVTQDEIMQAGFDWVRVDNLSVGKARIWEWLFDNSQAAINPSKANVRAGIAECWKGTAADLAVQAAVLAHCRRACNRVERLFATGTGSEAVPGLMTFEGMVSPFDIALTLNEV